MTPEVEVGDRVVLIDSDDCDPMRIVDINVGPAGEVTVDETPILDYPGNEDYSEDDTVVSVAFESKLDSMVPNWEDRINDLDVKLAEYKSEWKVDVPTYYYLLPRLRVSSDIKA